MALGEARDRGSVRQASAGFPIGESGSADADLERQLLLPEAERFARRGESAADGLEPVCVSCRVGHVPHCDGEADWVTFHFLLECRHAVAQNTAMRRALGESPDKGLIIALGGAEAVAKRLGAHRTTVVNWQRRGVPAAAWPAFAALCRDHGLEVDDSRAIAASRRLIAKGRNYAGRKAPSRARPRRAEAGA